jgi:hypothetical protein
MARRALLVGINHYPNPANRLNGCLNDVAQMESVLERHFAFDAPGAITVLLDEAATTRAIRTGLARLADARPGDVLVFHYSGHGSQVPDRDGDEKWDRLDEVLCPWDMSWEDPITDDDLREVVESLPPGVHLTVVLDCCHSGTALKGVDARRRKCLPPPVPRNPAASVHRIGQDAAAAGAVLLAGCRADQSSADALIEGEYHGAHTYFLCKALAASGYRTSYEQLVRDLRRELRRNGFDQVPQLEGPAALLREQVLLTFRQLLTLP